MIETKGEKIIIGLFLATFLITVIPINTQAQTSPLILEGLPDYKYVEPDDLVTLNGRVRNSGTEIETSCYVSVMSGSGAYDIIGQDSYYWSAISAGDYKTFSFTVHFAKDLGIEHEGYVSYILRIGCSSSGHGGEIKDIDFRVEGTMGGDWYTSTWFILLLIGVIGVGTAILILKKRKPKIEEKMLEG